MKVYVEPEWSNVDKKLKKLDLSATESEEDDEEAEEEEGENAAEDEEIYYSEDELFCVACDKAFKNEKSKETSSLKIIWHLICEVQRTWITNFAKYLIPT